MKQITAMALAALILSAVAGAQDKAEAKALLEYEKNTISIFEKVAPSVVFITNKGLRRSFFSGNTFEVRQGSGSGFMWDNKGHIVTNFHVIRRASKLSVTLADGSTFDAEVVGVEPSKDLAVLKIKAKPEQLNPVRIGASKDLKVGQKVLAIGTPFGLDQTLTVGVVSALGREIDSLTGRKIHDVVQTDAAINPGNSGGPLLDSNGRLIGVNTAIFSPNGASAGIGFAVPVDTVRWIVPQLITHGKVIRPGLGVTLVQDHIARRLRIDGVIVAKVLPGSGAETAKLEGLSSDRRGRILLGDVIVSIKGKPVKTTNDVADILERCKIGEKVTVEYIRDRKKRKAEIELQRID